MEASLTPLPARSVVLSLMLGSHPDRWTPARLAAAAPVFGIAPATLRVALSRAVAAGDLRRDGGDYVLGERLARRQRHQDEAVEDAESGWGGGWDGAWEMAVVTVTGRSGAERAALRETLAEHRLAELREGVWTRPANLRRPASYAGDPVLTTFRSTPTGDPAALAADLWDLAGWAATGRRLVATLTDAEEPALRLAAAAALVRHLAEDPLLPASLLPESWPGAELRAAYAAYVAELNALLATL
ncbi:PaaX family transcriptional regulator C-terminal domain-containing protein [Nocardioides sp. GY 10113]|uniref:PaaX family transcriptional regulator C-terminal domain-containing protein n=1 Tax=Nocardioides sp. GY 10113 TaxID=2569761 RepID=UPI001F109D20|nr:PaaX family transcriptional regulator C-terminal domain-containing protein [Nocardioides sp. GY 10113]